MKKFTFIAEFRGGTYITQYNTVDILEALLAWVDYLDTSIYPQRIIRKLQKEIKREQPIPIKGVDNVWCCSFSPYNSFLLLNIIETK
ncbi:hypothetical protein GGR21_003462 [Dysgonomonas hofstadii]|uniref:Uncharacterized protein n=1 Tax=Dysgonomonas hofstadii TaxID=637886 RepID=A0A840CXP9_9BACT|nr:hypothetical protein [Dysgonomonas hofstadii]MBB4037545.1 hypothetical protein [Dysgonomonas hofstadii]